MIMAGATLFPRISAFASLDFVASPSSRSNIAKAIDVEASVIIVKAFHSGSEDEQVGNMNNGEKNNRGTGTRREVLSRATTTASAWWAMTAASTTLALTANPSTASALPEEDVKEMRALIEQANKQLETVLGLLQEEKWDGVRTILMEAPLRDCWSKSTPILKKYAEALGETPKGDELAALEGREDLLQHLRFLDMAVYNNVFNPIATEGKTGASKALIDSYYNDPKREYEASKRAIESLIQLSD